MDMNILKKENKEEKMILKRRNGKLYAAAVRTITVTIPRENKHKQSIDIVLL